MKTYDCLFQCVERLDLAGMDFIWRIAMESPDEDIANEAIQLIITYSYINLNPKMKKVNSQIFIFFECVCVCVLLFHFSVNRNLIFCVSLCIFCRTQYLFIRNSLLTAIRDWRWVLQCEMTPDPHLWWWLWLNSFLHHTQAASSALGGPTLTHAVTRATKMLTATAMPTVATSVQSPSRYED